MFLVRLLRNKNSDIVVEDQLTLVFHSVIQILTILDSLVVLPRHSLHNSVQLLLLLKIKLSSAHQVELLVANTIKVLHSSIIMMELASQQLLVVNSPATSE